MRKLQILKAIVDFLWIFSMPVILILLGLAVSVYFIDIASMNIKINAIHFNADDTFSKILLSISSINYLLLIGALYYFRETLSHFIRVRIFEDVVIKNFKKIGNLLVISGIISTIISIVSKIYFESKFHIEIGLNPHIVVLCLGLFFMILSEIFKIAKNTKQENDLTI